MYELGIYIWIVSVLSISLCNIENTFVLSTLKTFFKSMIFSHIIQMMNNDSTIKINYPGIEKKYISGRLFPDIKVGVRQVNLSPSEIMTDGKIQKIPNKPIYIYDTTGAYSDANYETSYRDGLPVIRRNWVSDRKKGQTQMYFAKKGIITPEMEYVAIRESMNASMLGIEAVTPDFVRSEVAAGRAIIPGNVRHQQLEPMIIGSRFSVKTSTNIIVDKYSRMESYNDVENVIKCCEWGFDSINVLNRCVDVTYDRMLRNVPVPMGCTPIIDAYSRIEGDVIKLSWDFFKDVILEQTETGIDILNIHCDKENIESRKPEHNMSIGGAIMNEWCLKNGRNNFIYEHFDEICDICAATDTMIQISSTYRHSCIYDSNNQNDMQEKELMRELIEVANRKNVQILVEGFGFSSLDKVRHKVDTHKHYCPDTPFNTSIPAVVDMSLPHINTSRTIGSSIAGYLGSSLLCYDILQRKLNTNDEICRREAVSFNISSYSVNLARGHMDTALRNNASHRALKEMRINDYCNLSIDPEVSRQYFDENLKNPLIIGKTVVLL